MLRGCDQDVAALNAETLLARIFGKAGRDEEALADFAHVSASVRRAHSGPDQRRPLSMPDVAGRLQAPHDT